MNESDESELDEEEMKLETELNKVFQNGPDGLETPIEIKLNTAWDKLLQDGLAAMIDRLKSPIRTYIQFNQMFNPDAPDIQKLQLFYAGLPQKIKYKEDATEEEKKKKEKDFSDQMMAWIFLWSTSLVPNMKPKRNTQPIPLFMHLWFLMMYRLEMPMRTYIQTEIIMSGKPTQPELSELYKNVKWDFTRDNTNKCIAKWLIWLSYYG